MSQHALTYDLGPALQFLLGHIAFHNVILANYQVLSIIEKKQLAQLVKLALTNVCNALPCQPYSF